MPIKIEGYDVYGFVDHDYEVLKQLTCDGRIKWFEYRYKKILFNPIEDIRKITKENKGLLESEHTSIYTMIMLAIIVSIDTFGGFLCGIEGNNNDSSFKKFVEVYLDRKGEYYKKPFRNYNEFSSLLRELFRNGLAHNFTIKKIGFCHEGEYFWEDKDHYYVNVHKLFEDLKQGFSDFLQDISSNKIINGKSLKDNFMKRFEWVIIKGN